MLTHTDILSHTDTLSQGELLAFSAQPGHRERGELWWSVSGRTHSGQLYPENTSRQTGHHTPWDHLKVINKHTVLIAHAPPLSSLHPVSLCSPHSLIPLIQYHSVHLTLSSPHPVSLCSPHSLVPSSWPLPLTFCTYFLTTFLSLFFTEHLLLLPSLSLYPSIKHMADHILDQISRFHIAYRALNTQNEIKTK